MFSSKYVGMLMTRTSAGREVVWRYCCVPVRIFISLHTSPFISLHTSPALQFYHASRSSAQVVCLKEPTTCDLNGHICL